MVNGKKTALAAAVLAALGCQGAFAKAGDQEAKLIELDDPRYEQYYAARMKFWSAMGDVDSDVIAHIISPELMGGASWPTTRQAYLVVRTPSSVILASDGLSDLFVGTDLADAGFETEVYLETSDLMDADFDGIASSWQLCLVQNLAETVANHGGISQALDKHGLVSIEFAAPVGTPERWIDEDGVVGALLNVQPPGRPGTTNLAEGVPIDIISLTPLLPDELAYAKSGGAAARAELAEKLVAMPRDTALSGERPSVLALRE